MEAFDRAMQSPDVYSNPTKDMKILDAGAGSGAIGEMLKARGYTNVDALDISQEMLNLAATKNVYKKLICAPLKDTHMEEMETAKYDVLLCAGVIVYGQVKPGAIEECARFVKPGMSRQWYRPYAKMAAVNFCHREELFVNRNKLLHCEDQVKRNHCMKF